MAKLNDNTRTEIENFLFDCLRDSMFGDGLEDDYIRHGVEFKGLSNYTDQELVEEMLNYTSEEEELVIKAKAELAIEEMLKES